MAIRKVKPLRVRARVTSSGTGIKVENWKEALRQELDRLKRQGKIPFSEDKSK